MHNLNLLLSSSEASKLLVNELLLLDVFDRFLFSDFKFFNGVSFLLDLKLPFNNSLLKFKNKIYLVLYFLIFELLFLTKPQVVPIYSRILTNNNVSSKMKKKKVYSGKKIEEVYSSIVVFFRLSCIILDNNVLTNLSVFISKNTYKDLVVLSRFIKTNVKSTQNKKISSLILKSATNVFEFLSNFDEFVISKAQIKINFSFENFVGLFLMQAFGFNTLSDTFKALLSNKKIYLI